MALRSGSDHATQTRPVPSARRVARVAVAWFEYLVVALFAFVPQLASQPGVVDSDTKSYLFIDPARFIAQSASMWDPDIALGTVTHQQLGYLFPMGPFFLATHSLGIPVWAAQRLWVGATLFAAGAGVIYLAHTPQDARAWRSGRGRRLHALAVLLAVRRPDLGDPALVGGFALARRPCRPGAAPGRLAVPRSVRSRGARRGRGERELSHLRRASGPLLWLPYAVLVSREQTWRRVWGVLWRTGLLTLAVSLWWIVGLEIEGGYGLDVLKYTETVQAVSQTSYASEVLRGLGLLVLLRFGPHRAVGRDLDTVHPADLADRDQLRRAGRRVRLGRGRALATPRVLRPLDPGRARAFGRGEPLQQPVASRSAAQVGDDRHDRRARHALDGPGVAPVAPRHLDAARRGGQRAGAPQRPARRACSGGGGDRRSSARRTPRCSTGRRWRTTSPSRLRFRRSSPKPRAH